MGDLIGLVAIVMIFGIPMLAIWTRRQSKLIEHQSALDSADIQLLLQQVETLQDRVQVLERIVTDRGFDVSSQIEQLREESPRLSDRARN